ncbi:helix-turn-helix domain-containing protein [Bordetella bronchiseptica]|nr:helix-turn-helix transcriptional regulator [Bordetella bronchiseptica]AUV49956.1 XRE family transcriptional regulator [Bordetella bronchiseptica]
MSTLAERLREAMDDAGIKQVQVARAAGIKPPSVADWLNGKTKNIRGANLVSVAQLLNVSEAWLADGVLPKERRLDSDWPFPKIPKQRYYTLSEAQRAGIEEWVARQVEAYASDAESKSSPNERAA